MAKKICSRRESLLTTARKLFARVGVDRTTTRDIAQESDVNISMISYHFGGKDGLYKSVIEEFAKKNSDISMSIMANFDKRPMTVDTFKDDMKSLIRLLVKVRTASPDVLKLLSREKNDGLKMSGEIHDQLFYPVIDKFCKFIAAAQKNKIVDSELIPEIFFCLIMEGVMGSFIFSECETMFARKCAPIIKDTEKFENQIFKTYIQGIIL